MFETFGTMTKVVNIFLHFVRKVIHDRTYGLGYVLGDFWRPLGHFLQTKSGRPVLASAFLFMRAAHVAHKG
jgi:hypothetical protein